MLPPRPSLRPARSRGAQRPDLYPAQIAGLADRLGSIEPGKEATLFAADGDILDIRANVKHMRIAGKEISLETRHTRLYEK
jgi:N-acetylglucosamine-6-phosphate deacetylase